MQGLHVEATRRVSQERSEKGRLYRESKESSEKGRFDETAIEENAEGRAGSSSTGTP